MKTINVDEALKMMKDYGDFAQTMKAQCQQKCKDVSVRVIAKADNRVEAFVVTAAEYAAAAADAEGSCDCKVLMDLIAKKYGVKLVSAVYLMELEEEDEKLLASGAKIQQEIMNSFPSDNNADTSKRSAPPAKQTEPAMVNADSKNVPPASGKPPFGGFASGCVDVKTMDELKAVAEDFAKRIGLPGIMICGEADIDPKTGKLIISSLSGKAFDGCQDECEPDCEGCDECGNCGSDDCEDCDCEGCDKNCDGRSGCKYADTDEVCAPKFRAFCETCGGCQGPKCDNWNCCFGHNCED